MLLMGLCIVLLGRMRSELCQSKRVLLLQGSMVACFLNAALKHGLMWSIALRSLFSKWVRSLKTTKFLRFSAHFFRVFKEWRGLVMRFYRSWTRLPCWVTRHLRERISWGLISRVIPPVLRTVVHAAKKYHSCVKHQSSLQDATSLNLALNVHSGIYFWLWIPINLRA